MFSFGFNLDDGDGADVPTTDGTLSMDSGSDELHAQVPAIEVPRIDRPAGDVVALRLTTCYSFSLVMTEEDESSPLAKYDIIPGSYEGGLKIWEGSLDLARLLLSDPQYAPLSHQAGSVLELGCGHGIPGIAALRLGYRSAVFSDFNREVLDLTWANVQLNCSSDSCAGVRCFAGDWLSLSSLLSSECDGLQSKYSLILSAETLYNVEVCRKVFVMISRHLDEDGMALVASKKYYFGVGGGTSELESLCEQRESALRCTVIETIADGQSNIREILRLTRARPSVI